MTRRKLNGRNTTSPVLQHHVRPRRALAARVYGAHGCCKAFARVGGRGPVVLRTVGVAAEHCHEPLWFPGHLSVAYATFNCPKEFMILMHDLQAMMEFGAPFARFMAKMHPKKRK